MFYTGRFHLSCFCSNTCTFISPVSAPTPALPYFLFLLQHQHFRLYCFCYHLCASIFTDWFCSHTCTSISTVSIPTPAFPFLLFMFPHLLFHLYCFCTHTCTFIFTVSAPTPALSSLLFLLLFLHWFLHCFCCYSCTFIFPVQGFHGQGKVMENQNFQGQGKVREFFKKSGKIFDIVKVREFCFPVYRSKLFFKTWNAFSLAKIKRMLQSKQSDQFDTLRLNVVVILWSLVFVVYDFLIIPSSLSAKSGKRLNMKRKMSMACKKN